MWWIKQVEVVDPAQTSAGRRDVLIKAGRIQAIAEKLTLPEAEKAAAGEEIEAIDGTGQYLFPGLVDVHTHLREPGQEDKEDIRSGARAAVRGGFTSIMAMANTTPVIDNRALVEFVSSQGKKAGYAKVYPISCVTKGMGGSELVEMLDVRQGGAVAFSDDGKGIQNGEVMRLALEYAKLTGQPIISHCEDEKLAGGGSIRRGKAAARLGLQGIPASAESAMVARDLLLAGETGGKLHLAHLSTKESVALVRLAKKAGIDVTAEVNPHHLIFCDEDIALTDTSMKVNPPFGSVADREALIAGLADGTIDMLATDHAPHLWEEKNRPLGEAPFGIIGLETALPAVWQYLVQTGKISVERLIEAWSTIPARRFNLPAGNIAPGSPADLVLFDPARTETIERKDLCSKAQNTPFLGRTMTGLPVMTWVEGRLVQQDRRILDF